ncbi:hypothetical protein P43SY_006208 [Pythium insidiosum]|uniref:EF-hand domain-containing protein n=1 Tax=Pythium insidiosum TaxID=114742 RepID=A0AAD5LGF3_PYTIN|nr:hypothetical protein P43SY_006208 [Pythium insidiosum]
MAQLSPRRAMDSSKFAVMTLPFMEDISPSAALKRLYKWFVRDSSARDRSDEQADEDGVNSEDDPDGGSTISRDEFNRLQRCIGKPVIMDREWRRALEALGIPDDQEQVKRKDFKALFGPPPFFGSENVQGIVKYVMAAEEHIHFAQVLLDRFGVDVVDRRFNGKGIGLEELQSIQRACCLDRIFGDAEWKELLKKLFLAETTQYLDWMHFSEAFTVIVKGKKVFGDNGDPTSVVYAVLANDKVMDTVKDPNDTIVSQKAFTNLLRIKKTKVDDEKWMNLLESMQSTYELRSGRRRRADSSADAAMAHDAQDEHHGHEQPLVVVRNTRNQVLSYEITFAEHGDVGIELQSDFYGHCLTVKSIGGEAAKHPIIQKHDIVAAIDDNTQVHQLTLEPIV